MLFSGNGASDSQLVILTLESCLFEDFRMVENGSTTRHGGVIFLNNASVKIKDCVFRDCFSFNHGGFYLVIFVTMCIVYF
jgi:hypothetical protein